MSQKFMDEATKYLTGLKTLVWNDKEKCSILTPLYKTKRSTCIIGLITAMQSLKLIMNDIILPGNSSLKYLPTYKLSQDSIELFFSSLRQRFGNNNNPNVQQLQSALKKMLCVRISPSKYANCTEQEEIFTPKLSPFQAKKLVNSPTQDKCEDPDDFILSTNALNLVANNIVTYIAGFVGRSVIMKVECSECCLALLQLEDSITMSSQEFTLLNVKNNGGLFVPSRDLIEICKITESASRSFIEQEGVHNVSKERIKKAALKIVLEMQLFAELRTVDTIDHDMFGNHVMKLTELVLESYIKVRLHHLAKEESRKLSPETNRNKFNKLILFSGN